MLNRILGGLLALSVVLSVSFASAETLSTKAFRELYMKQAKGLSPAICMRVKDDTTFAFGPGEADCERYLATIDNAYGEYIANPEALDIIVLRYAALVAATVDRSPTDERNIKQRLVALLRPDNYGLQPGSRHSNLVRREFLGDLDMYLFLNSPERLRAVDKDFLQAADLTADEAFSLALKNNDVLLGRIDRVRQDDGLVLLDAESGLITGAVVKPDACRDGWKGLAVNHHDRGYIVAAPENDTLAVKALWTFVDASKKRDEGMSHAIYACREGKMTVLNGG